MKKKRVSVLAAVAFLGTILATALPETGAADALTAYYDSGSFVGQPTVSAEVTDEESLAALKGGQQPASVIFTVDETLSVVGEEGSLGEFSGIYAEYAEGKMFPVIRPVSAAALVAFCAYEAENELDEFAILSSDAVLLVTAHSECPDAYIFMETSVLYTIGECATALERANLACAQVILVPQESCTEEKVRYLQARFKSVWVYTDGSASSVADAVGCGVYGIVTPDAANVYAVYDKIAGAAEAYEGTGSLAVLARAPFIAAHRGDITEYSENTVGAVLSAGSSGATHVEIDIRLTADNEIVLLHDDDIRYALRNEDGSAASGNVSRMTLAQLKTFSMSDGVSRIATIDEIFEAAKTEEAENLLLIIEIKSSEPALVSLFADKVEEYGMADRVLLISFTESQLAVVQREMPSASCSLLLYTSNGDTAVSKALAAGTGIDMQFDGSPNLRSLYGDGTSAANSYNAAFRTFADRGYSFWMWTYKLTTMNEAIRNGVTGITTDDPRFAQDMAKTLLCESVYEVDELPGEYGEFTVAAETYAGEKKDIPATVVWLEKGEKEGTAILVGRTENAVGLVSGAVTFRVSETETSSGKGSGCGSAAAAWVSGAGALAAAGLFAAGKRRR